MIACARCKQQKLDDEFAWRNRAKGTRQNYCRPCRKEIDQEYWQKHKDRIGPVKNRRRKRWNADRVEWIYEYKKKPCTDCGVQYDPWVMDFDHLRDKKFDVSTAAQNLSKEVVLAEIEKCEVVCANCHRQRTHKRRPL